MVDKIPDADNHFAFAYDSAKMVVEHQETRNQQVYVTRLFVNPDGSYTTTATKHPVNRPPTQN